MKLQKLLTLLLFVITNAVFSQEKIQHSVSKGESVYSIAQKYNVKPAEILALNPKAKKTLQLNMVLQIPSKNKVEEKKIETVEHEVAAKETLYGLSKKYNTSIDKIKEANPAIETEGLKIGLKLIIPTGESKVDAVASKKEEKPIQKEVVAKKEEVKKIEKAPVVLKEEVKEASISGEQIVHEVHGISKKYGVSIAELESLNPEIKNGLAVGVKLLVKKGSQNENVLLENKKETKIAVVEKSEEKPIAEKKVEKKEDKKSGSQFKVIGRVESDKNDEVAEVKPQIEEADEEADETTQTQAEVVEVEPLTPENMTKAEFLIAKASENLGARYRSGATGNGGFDCSGLMFSTFKNIEMTLPRSSRDMAANAGVRIDRSQAQKGDLIFFATRGRGVSHVGMITEVAEDEIKFIHSSTSAGVIISSVKEPYYARRFVQINRVLN